MSEQVELGVEVSSINFEKFKKLGEDQELLQKINSPNFTILDNEYLYVTYIENDKVAHIILTKDGESLKAAKKFADILRYYGKKHTTENK